MPPSPRSPMEAFLDRLTSDEKRLLGSLDSPSRIQAFIDTIPYSEDHFYRCPLRVLRDRKAHCFDGSLFAAMALRRIGFPPRVLELIPNARDDDHMLAVFKVRGHWGAIAQSNFTGLRSREPVYRTLRELCMSYFADFFNQAGELTLVGYRSPIDLRVFDKLDWMGSDDGLETLADGPDGMERYRVHKLITDEQAAHLEVVDRRSLQAGLLGSNPDGLFKVS
jgi:hypothetical protein